MTEKSEQEKIVYLSDEDIAFEIEKVQTFFKGVEDCKKANVAIGLIFEIAAWAGFSYYESLGILEEVKKELQDTFQDICAEESEGDEKDEESEM